MSKSTLPAAPDVLATLDLKTVKYFPGKPRNYKFNAKEGVFFDDKEEKLGKSGASLKVVPLSYRTFFAEIFKMDRREWLELFFLNAAGHVCSGAPVQRRPVADLSAHLFYEEAARSRSRWPSNPTCGSIRSTASISWPPILQGAARKGQEAAGGHPQILAPRLPA